MGTPHIAPTTARLQGTVYRVPESSLHEAALHAFIELVKRWRLTEEQARGLLGQIASSTYYKWKNAPGAVRLGQDTMTRISLLAGIYKALHICFGNALADEWPTLGNTNAMFQGEAPLAFMLRHGQPGMVRVRSMLDGWSAGN